jgi:hypothetical protein
MNDGSLTIALPLAPRTGTMIVVGVPGGACVMDNAIALG